MASLRRTPRLLVPRGAVLAMTVVMAAQPACSDSDARERGRPDSGFVAAGGAATGGAPTALTGGRPGAGGTRESNSGGSPGDAAALEGTISARYPGDRGIEADRRVLFHSGFEDGFTGWTRHTDNPSQLQVLSGTTLAHSGTQYLRAEVTRTALAANPYISANAQLDLPRRVPELYFRFYARFVGMTAVPHHWVRVAAGVPSYDSDGLANTVPPGDGGFWFDLDARKDGFFNFYTYWYKMRSGRCNDGTAVPGCAGDQGSTYYYGNNFTPSGQSAFPRDTWFCLETYTKANTIGASDGALALFKDEALVGRYEPGTPRGRWLRDNFYSWGEYYLDDGPFEGFDFRSAPDVLLKRVTLDAYYEKGTLDDLATTTSVPEAQTILYDDVVVATARIGCMVQGP